MNEVRSLLCRGARLLAMLAICVPLQAQETGSQPTIEQLETSVASGSATVRRQLELAQIYLDRQRFWEARELAQSVLSENPGSEPAQRIIAAAERELAQLRQTRIEEVDRILSTPGISVEQRLSAADTLFEAGQYLGAAEQYELVPERERTAQTRLRHARALAWSGRLDEAERIYAELHEEAPDPALDLEYGRLLSWMGATDAAVSKLRSAYEAEPAGDAIIALANAYAWEGRRTEALDLLDEHLASHPSDVEARVLRDQIASGNEIVIEQLTRRIEEEPFNLSLRLGRAQLLIDAGRYSAAIEDLDHVDRHSKRADSTVERLRNEAREGRERELSTVNERRRQLDLRSADSAPEILEMARAYSGLGEYDEAAALYVRYLEVRPDDVDARIAYARVLQWDERWNDSARQYERVLEQAPHRADVRLEHARVLAWDRRFVPAVQALEELVSLDENPRAHLYTDVPVEARFSLGQIYRWFGWNDHAVSYQTSALDLDGGFEPARRELDIVRHLRPATVWDARYSHYENSSDFTMDRVDLEMTKWNSRRTAFDAVIGRHHFDRDEFDFQATSLGAGIRYRQTDQLTPRARVGVNIYDDDAGTRPWWNLGADWRPSLQTRTAVEYAHYDLVYDVHNTRALGDDPLEIDDLRAHYDHHTGGVWSWMVDGSYGWISDDNTRLGLHGLLTFRVLNEPYVALKADVRHLEHDFRSPRYWSPRDYQSAAAVLHVGDDVRQRFFWEAELKYGRAWEGEFESDIRAIEARVTVPINEVIDLVGNWAYGESGRLEALPVGDDLVNYWQRRFYVGIRIKRRYDDSDRRGVQPYYFDDSSLQGSPVIPPEVR